MESEKDMATTMLGFKVRALPRGFRIWGLG